jgi:hypothetical protein
MEGIWKAVAGVAFAAAAAASIFIPGGQAFTVPLANAALAMGASFVAENLLDAGEEENPTGVVLNLKVGGDVPRAVAIGKCGTAGHLIYGNVSGADNKFLDLVFILSDGWCTSLDKIWIDGRERNLQSVAVGSTNAVARFDTAKYGNSIDIRFFDGRYSQNADTVLVANANPGTRWTANSRLRGICYVAMTLTYDEKKFPNGMPEFFFEFSGARLYDPRKDSTNGGTGTHRWNDPSTYEFSENAALGLLNYRLGHYVRPNINDESTWVRIAGMAMDQQDISIPGFAAAADTCDQNVSLASGNEKRFRCSLFVSDAARHLDNVEKFQTAMAGWEAERRGVLYPIPGAAQTPVRTITDADLAVGHQLRCRPSKTVSRPLMRAMRGILSRRTAGSRCPASRSAGQTGKQTTASSCRPTSTSP